MNNQFMFKFSKFFKDFLKAIINFLLEVSVTRIFLVQRKHFLISENNKEQEWPKIKTPNTKN